MDTLNESTGSGFTAGIGCAVIPATAVAALWGLYTLVTTVINEVVETRAETITAQAQAAVVYAQARQMDAVTQAMQAHVAQGTALPWLLGVAFILALVMLAWSQIEQAKLRRLVMLAAMGKLGVANVEA